MVEFANELQLKEKLDKRSAIEMAARVRLRPILMTTAAMVTGLLPLLTASGAGASAQSIWPDSSAEVRALASGIGSNTIRSTFGTRALSQ